VSELQLRLDSVKQEAGANKVKLQVNTARALQHFLTTRRDASFVVDWKGGGGGVAGGGRGGWECVDDDLLAGAGC
jgi:hypothetical protein